MKIISLLMMIFLIGCNTKEEETSELKIFDPRVPGGNLISNPKIQDVIGLEAEAYFDRVKLTWINPSIYIGQDHKIHVFRINGDGSNFTFPDPNIFGSTYYLYYPRLDFVPFKSDIYVDANDENNLSVTTNDQFTYYVYVEKGGRFSSGKKITVTIPELGGNITLPNPTEFWKNYDSRTGLRPDPDTLQINFSTLSAGKPTVTRLKGDMVYAKNNTMLFISDTDNNRVMVYANLAGKSCYDNHTQGSIEFDICIAVNGMAPLTPYAVIGQRDFGTSYSCQDASNPLGASDCLTAPTGLAVKNNQLFISDSGNNRVKIYDTTPFYGCYNLEAMSGDDTPDQCSPSRVIGKRSLSDLANYSLALEGDAALSCPNGLEVYNNNLYIADTCNNRVVVAFNVTDASLFNCTAVNWRTSRCIFGGVLGQADFNSNDNFESRWDLGEFSYDYINDTLVGDLNYLRRHIRNPSKILIRDNKMFISSNEDFSKSSPFGDLTLFGRVLRYDTMVLEGTFPACNSTSFAIGGCDANWVFGQRGFNRIPVTPFGGNYTDYNYTIKNVGGFEIVGSTMLLSDSDTNLMNLWENIADNTILGSPATYRIENPLGVWDPDRNRAQPNLKGIGSIIYHTTKRSVFIHDAGSNYIYQISIYRPNTGE